MLDAKLEELEAMRTRSSLPLAEEKALLRQMQVIQKEKRTLDEYDRHERKIRQKKEELDKLREIYRQKLEAISELDTILAKVQLAQKLDCSPNDLKSRSILCPEKRLGQLIGKNGANVRLIEARTGVQIDVDKEESKIHMSGSEAALEKAAREVEAIALAVDKTVPLSKATMTYLTSSKRLRMLDKFRAKHRVRINFAEGGSAVVLTGIPERIATAETDLATMQVRSLSKILTSREASLIVGKGGATVNALTDKHGVAIIVNKNQGGDSSTVIVDGPSSAAEAAIAEIETMVAANKDVEVFVNANPMQRQYLLADQGKRIGAAQVEINEEMGVQKDMVRLAFRKDAVGKGSKLLIRTKQIYAAKAKELVQQRLDEFNSECCTTLHAPLGALPQIVGRGGQMVKKLRALGAGGEIEVEKDTGVIIIQADNEEEREKIKVAVEAIIAKNQIREIPIQKNLIGRVLGGPGKEMRDEMNRIGVTYRMNPEDTHFVLRGTAEQVDRGAVLVLDLLGSNYVEEYEIPSHEEKALFQGGENSLVRRVEKEHDVTLIYRTSEHRLFIRGKEDNVKAGVQRIKQVFEGGDGFAVVRMSLPDGTAGTIIGKRGKNVKAIEAEYSGVSIQVSDDSNSSAILTMRGPEEKVEEARSKIVASLATAKMEESVPISSDQKEKLEKESSFRDVGADTNTQITVTSSSVRIRGVSSDVRYAKGRVMEILTGSYISYIDLDAGQYSIVSTAVSKDPSHFERIRTSTETDLDLDDDMKAVCVTGNRSGVEKAKSLLFDFLDFVLSSSMEHIKVDKSLMKSMDDASALAGIVSASGASISIDRDLSFVVIRSTDSDKVQTASKLVKDRIVELERLVYVHRLSQPEAWLLPNIIGKGGSTIRSLETDSGCSVEASKEALTIIVRGMDEEKVSAVATKLIELIDTLKKECAFIDIPNEAQPAFIGKSGDHITSLRDEYNVTIEILPEGRLQVQGSESNVQSAKAAIGDWMKAWEEQHIGKSFAIEGSDIPVIGSKGSVVNSIQKDFGVMINIDRDAGMVTIRGGKVTEDRDAAEEKVKDIIRQHHADVAKKEEERKAAAAAARAEKQRREKAAAGSSDGTGASNTKTNGKSLASDTGDSRKSRSNEYLAVPVGMTVTASKKSASKKKDRVSLELCAPAHSCRFLASGPSVPTYLGYSTYTYRNTDQSALVYINSIRIFSLNTGNRGRTQSVCVAGCK